MVVVASGGDVVVVVAGRNDVVVVAALRGDDVVVVVVVDGGIVDVVVMSGATTVVVVDGGTVVGAGGEFRGSADSEATTTSMSLTRGSWLIAKAPTPTTMPPIMSRTSGSIRRLNSMDGPFQASLMSLRPINDLDKASLRPLER